MVKKWLGLAALLGGITFASAACGGDDAPAATATFPATATAPPTSTTAPEPTATARPTATPPPPTATPPVSVPGYPADKRTGVPAIDKVVEAILSGDPAKAGPLLVFTPVACVAKQDGIGAPPLCPAGVAEGTIVDAFAVGSCEGGFTVRGDEAGLIQNLAGPGHRLYAAWEVELRDGTPGYAVLFGAPGQNAVPVFAHTAYVSAAGIVTANFGCGASPKDRLAFLKITKFLLPPPP
jgi:hypothetical protein